MSDPINPIRVEPPKAAEDRPAHVAQVPPVAPQVPPVAPQAVAPRAQPVAVTTEPAAAADTWFERYKVRLEVLKLVVEILAIVVAGGWTFYEFVYKRTQERLGGESFSWATLKLDGDAAPLPNHRAWLHARLRVENRSKRTVQPLVVTWFVETPPKLGETRPTVVKAWNEIDVWDDIRPGQETERSTPIIVENSDERAFVVHAEMVFRRVSEDGEECMIDPDQPPRVPGETAKQPKICLKDSRTGTCKAGDNLCPGDEWAEKLLVLPEPAASPAPAAPAAKSMLKTTTRGGERK